MKRSQVGVQPTVKILKNLIRFGSFLGFFPYKWDRKTKRVCRSSRAGRYIYRLWTLAMASYSVFLIYGWYMTLHDPASSSFNRVRSFYVTAINTGLMFGFCLNSDGNQLVINQIFHFTLNFKAKFGMELKPAKLNLSANLILFTYCVGCSNFLALLRTPDSKRFLTSVLQSPKEAPFALIAPFMLVHFLLSACQFFYIGFNLLVLFCYGSLVTPVMERLRWSNHATTTRMPNLSPELVHHQSIALLVLESAFTSAYGPWVMMIMTCGICMCILNVFQSIVFWHVRSLILGTALVLLVWNITKSSAQVYEAAVEARQTWLDGKNPLWFSKHVRAWKAARVPMGSFFFFDNGLALTFMDIIFTTSVNLIVSYRE